jgi:hypothetical protein
LEGATKSFSPELCAGPVERLILVAIEGFSASWLRGRRLRADARRSKTPEGSRFLRAISLFGWV